MKEIEAESVWFDEDENEIDEPYFQLKDGRRVLISDVGYADWKDTDGQCEAAFFVARAGTGELISLVAGDDAVWLTTSDKIQKPPAKVKRKKS